MLLPIESIYEGTWGSGSPPAEWVDFEIMHEMKWSFAQLQETPAYVRRYVWDCIQARRRAEHDAHEKQRRESERASRG